MVGECAGAARPLRRVVGGRRGRSAGRVLRGAAARPQRRGAARAQRCRRHRLHLLHLGHHGAAEDRHLRPRRLLAERPRHAGIPRPHRGRPHAGIPLVRLELGAGAEPAAVPAEGPHDAHRQAVLAQPLLRMGAASTASRSRPACRPCSTCCSTSRSAIPPRTSRRLRLMSCSTAPLTAQQWVQFEEMYGVTLLQMYGMSETGWICGNRTTRRWARSACRRCTRS